MLCITLLLGLSSDPDHHVRAAAIRALGCCVLYPCLREVGPLLFSTSAELTVSSRFAESHFSESRFAECRVSFSFHHFHFKFLSLMRYNLFMGVNEMRVKVLPLLCRLGLVLRLGSV